MKKFYNEYKGLIPYVVGFVALAGLSLYIDMLRWEECRAHGFSFLYCLGA